MLLSFSFSTCNDAMSARHSGSSWMGFFRIESTFKDVNLTI